ncbi:MAG: hypothetical protein ABEI96_10105 [Haloarculaceae archaeon]
MALPTFFDRFVHPRLAAAATAGFGVWALSFLIAGSGLALRATASYRGAALAFALSGWIGLAGIAVLACCALWLAGLFVRRWLA